MITRIQPVCVSHPHSTTIWWRTRFAPTSHTGWKRPHMGQNPLFEWLIPFGPNLMTLHAMAYGLYTAAYGLTVRITLSFTPAIYPYPTRMQTIPKQSTCIRPVCKRYPNSQPVYDPYANKAPPIYPYTTHTRNSQPVHNLYTRITVYNPYTKEKLYWFLCIIYYLMSTFQIYTKKSSPPALSPHKISISAASSSTVNMQNYTNTNPPPPQAMNTSHPSPTSPAANTWISIGSVTNLIINPTNTIGITGENPKRKEA